MKRMIDNKLVDEIINDIDNVKTQYVKGKIVDGEYRTFIVNENNSDNRDASLQYSNAVDENNFKVFSVGVNSGVGAYMSIIKKVSGVESSHSLILDEDGNLTLDGNAIGGGGTQEYTHNIIIRCTREGYKASCGITIKSTSNTPFTSATLISYLANEGHIDYTKCYTNCNGYMYTTQSYYVIGVFSENSRLYINGTTDGSSQNSQWFASANIDILQDFVK